MHPRVFVTQIRGPNPPREIEFFGDVGVPLIADDEFVVIATDGTRH